MPSISYILLKNTDGAMETTMTLLPSIKREENTKLYDFNCGVIQTYYKYICILALTILKMAT